MESAHCAPREYAPLHSGFLNASDKTNPEELVCVSFWTSREDADEYDRQRYDTIASQSQEQLEGADATATARIS